MNGLKMAFEEKNHDISVSRYLCKPLIKILFEEIKYDYKNNNPNIINNIQLIDKCLNSAQLKNRGLDEIKAKVFKRYNRIYEELGGEF